MTDWISHDRGSACPVCHHTDGWCRSSSDGRATACRRIERDGAVVRSDKNGCEFYLYVRGDGEPVETHTDPNETWREKLAEPDQRHAVYSTLLAELPLSEAHLANLRQRGLPGECIERGGYSSFPDDAQRDAAVAAVLKAHTYVLQVPGFFKRDGKKNTRLGGSPGLLIPVRDAQGRIVACSIRLDGPKSGKYRWLSAPPGTIGCGPGSVAHVPLHDDRIFDSVPGTTERHYRSVRLTEGALKADVATAISGVLTIGLPGVSAWKLALPVLSELRAKRVLLAFDADARRNKAVARALVRCATELAKAGYTVAIEVWPDDAGKGIDDALAAAGVDCVEVHEGREAWERISEIHAEAGAGKAPGADARAELDELLDRVRDDSALAFSEEVISAAAELEDGTPEFERLRSAMKSAKVRMQAWDRRVKEARIKRRSKVRVPDHERWKEELLYTKEGDVRRCTANVLTTLTMHPAWAGKLAYDAFAETPVCLERLPMRAQDNPGDIEPGDLTDADITRTAAWISSEVDFDPGVDMVYQAIAAAAAKRVIHPVRDYLSAQKWDGQARLDGWLSRYFGADDNDYTRAVGAKWMISAVARIFEPGCQVDCVLVLEGEQGRGKSTGLKTLFGAAWYSDTGLSIGDKDSYQCLRRKWLHEFGELDSFKGREATKVKNFISSQKDNYRPSFGRTSRDFPRQIVFAGTTNEDQYLVDRTGNRRFWPVRCKQDVDREGLARDRDQLWAEARVRYERGELWHVDTKGLRKLCEAQQQERETEEPWENLIAKWLANPKVPNGVGYNGEASYRDIDPGAGVTVDEILIGALKCAPDKMNSGLSCRVGTIMSRKLKWVRRRVTEPLPDDPTHRPWKYFRPVPGESAEHEPGQNRDTSTGGKDAHCPTVPPVPPDVAHTHRDDAYPDPDHVYDSSTSYTPTMRGTTGTGTVDDGPNSAPADEYDEERESIQSEGNGEVIRPKQWRVLL